LNESAQSVRRRSTRPPRLRRRDWLDLARLDPTIDLLRRDSESRAELRRADLAALDGAIDSLPAETADCSDLIGREKSTVRSILHPTPRLLVGAIVLLVGRTGTHLRATRLPE
jgi:hypothetical protein